LLKTSESFVTYLVQGKSTLSCHKPLKYRYPLDICFINLKTTQSLHRFLVMNVTFGYFRCSVRNIFPQKIISTPRRKSVNWEIFLPVAIQPSIFNVCSIAFRRSAVYLFAYIFCCNICGIGKVPLNLKLYVNHTKFHKCPVPNYTLFLFEILIPINW